MIILQFIPHDYQKAVAKHIVQYPGTGVFLGMGLGKTSIALMAILEEMYDLFEIKSVLIVAPKTVAEATWQDEARKWDQFQGLRFSTILGSKAERLKALYSPADIYVINRENVAWLMEQVHYKPPFDMLILDESTSFKDSKTKRWRAIRRVRGCFKKIVLLTGTPRPNSLMDLWAQLYLLDGGKRLGKSLTSFRSNYFLPDKRNQDIVYSWKVRNPAAEKEIYDKISDICISLKSEDYKNMPDVLPPVIIPVKLDKKSMDAYRTMAKECIIEMQGEEITALSAAAVSNKLLQLANGAIYDNDGVMHEVHNAKLDALADIASTNEGNPILVFYSYRSDLARILKKFPKARQLKSADDVRDWNAGKIEMLLAHPASAGYGLNLQAGGHIIVWFGLTWSLEQYQQANARLQRQGQKEPVIIHHLVVEGTLDTHVMAALKAKRLGQDAMMDAVKMLVKEVSA